MTRKTTLSAIGGWQSFLFCIGMYLVALFFSIFVCSSVFYVMNGRSSAAKESLAVKDISAKPILAAVTR